MLHPDYRSRSLLKRKDDRVIIHFDYDCFYASVVESENPGLKFLPLAIQQKQIVVTCNYEARRRGLHKLQLITEAKKICPDVVIVLGEDLTRFRDASKALYNFLRGFSWNDKVEKLGFDEVWMDVTDIINYNIGCLNPNSLSNSFFQLSQSDPTLGFEFDATRLRGYAFPTDKHDATLLYPHRHGPGNYERNSLAARLLLGSHLALHMKKALDFEKGYTATVGISTSKLLSKLVGNVHKPDAQTTLVPPYGSGSEPADSENNVFTFMDSHDIGKVPGIGFKLAQKIRHHVLGRDAAFDDGLIYGGTREEITVGMVRQRSDLSPDLLDKILSGPGAPRGIGAKVFELLHGQDDSEVAAGRAVPHQISIEDSYIRLDTIDQVLTELKNLASKLVQRMLTDLTEVSESSPRGQHLVNQSIHTADLPREVQHTAAHGGIEDHGVLCVDNDAENSTDKGTGKAMTVASSVRWLSFPTTLRLSTRPRLATMREDGTRIRTTSRTSRSMPIPPFLARPFRDMDIETLSKRLVAEALVPLFKKLHPQKSGWNLSLVNVAVTGMVDETIGSAGKGGRNRDIFGLFQRIDEHRDDLAPSSHDRKFDHDEPKGYGDGDDGAPEPENTYKHSQQLTAGDLTSSLVPDDDVDEDDDDNNAVAFVDDDGDAELDESDEGDNEEMAGYHCPQCAQFVPHFARVAHERFHSLV